MRVLLQHAFVLHRRSYQNSSLLLDLLSAEFGRLTVVAKGSKKSKQSGLLQPFQPLLVSWSGRGELKTLIAVEENGPPVMLPHQRSLSGLYLNELLIRLLPNHDAYPELFFHYHRTLIKLIDEVNEEALLRYFETHLLSTLGYQLLLAKEANTGRAISSNKNYHYILDHGPVINKQPQQDRSIQISGKSLLALHQGQLDGASNSTLRECKRLLRAALALRLDHRPLKTRELALALQNKKILSAQVL